MPRPSFITLEKSDLPTLIIDKEGSIGIGLYSKFKDLSQVVLVSSKKPKTEENLLFLSYKLQIPEIPSDTYGHIYYVVYSIKELNELLPALSEKTKQDNAKFFIVGERNLLTLPQLENIFSKSNLAGVVLLGDLFGNPIYHNKKSLIEEIIHSAKNKKAIKLPGVGLSKVYPVSFEDAVIELVRLSFTYNKKNRLYFLHTQYPITSLGLSHLLQKENPLLKIDFEKDEMPFENDSISIEGEYLLPADYDAVNKLRATYREMSNKNHSQEAEPITEFQEMNIVEKMGKEKPKNARYLGKFFLSTIVFLIFLAILPIVVAGAFGFMATINLQESLKNVHRGDLSTAKKQIFLAGQFIYLTKQTIPAVSFELSLFGKKDLSSINEKISLAQSATDDISKLLQISDSIQNIIKGKGSLKGRSLLDSVANIKNLIFTGEQIAQDKTIQIPKDVKNITGLSGVKSFANVVDAVPEILGESNPKTYLLLFQNNAELRPGGGFIGSYAILSLNKGNVQNFSIHDVYDADGQLKGHIEPPFAIRRYLTSVHLYLRDSNFDADFTKSAFMSAFIYEQEMKQKVDGVIAVDLSFLRSLIGLAGQVYVPAYKETVTKDNFFLLAENHSEKNFFPGSTQKQDFLRDTFSALQERISAGSGINYLNFLEVISTSLEQKHLLFAFANSHTQDLFTVNGFSSSLWDKRVDSPNAINDFLGVNEANLGVNKVNYLVSRKVFQRVVVNDDGTVSEQASINLINTSSGQWPGGGYKNFIRFILPGSAVLEKVEVNGSNQNIVAAVTDPLQYEAKNFLPPNGLEVEKADEEGKTLYGFLTSIPAGQSQTIAISYQLAKKIDVNLPSIVYSNDYFKQPGTDDYPFSFSIVFPKQYKSVDYGGGIKTSAQNLIYDGNINSDKQLNVTFALK